MAIKMRNSSLFCSKLLLFMLMAFVFGTFSHMARAQHDDEVLQAPLIVINDYINALKTGDRRNVAMYLDNATAMQIENFSFSPQSMGKEAETLSSCGLGDVKMRGKRAVVYFNPEMKNCTPYFMVFEKGKWCIDLLTMSKVIHYNTNNEWKADMGVKHPYMFIFKKKAE